MSRLAYMAFKTAGHIEQPYNLDEILDKIDSDDYCPELMLQHLLLYIARQENHAQREGMGQ